MENPLIERSKKLISRYRGAILAIVGTYLIISTIILGLILKDMTSVIKEHLSITSDIINIASDNYREIYRVEGELNATRKRLNTISESE